MNAFARALLPLLALSLAPAGVDAKPFPHKRHVLGVEMPCKACHDSKGDGLPVLRDKACGKCHEKLGKFTASRSVRLKDARFSHSQHAAKMECAGCHADVIQDQHRQSQPLIARTSCDACHAKRPFLHKVHLDDGGSCKLCHDSKAEGLPALKPKSCGKCHGGQTPKYASPKTKRLPDVAFPHPKHLEKAECADCHAAVVKDEHQPEVPHAAPAGCAKCHNKPFSHKVHVGEQEAPCKSCHDLKAAEAPPLKPKGCLKCHEGGLPPYVGPRPAKVEGLRFPHLKHAENQKLKCEDCHEATIQDERKDAAPIQTRADCKRCHSKPFSHKVHVGDQDAPCKSCHDVKAAGLPPLKTKGCDKCHDFGPPDYEGPKAVRLAKARFDHPVHAAKVECADCHGATVGDAHDGAALLTSEDACFRCHEERVAAVPPGSCARCHGEDLARIRPADHGAGWTHRHGEEAKWRAFGEHGRDCGDCHAPSTCTACHDQARPRNHTGLWRVRTHGQEASWDRERCAACHQTGLCVRCHATTRPVNHRAGWKHGHALVADPVEAPDNNCAVCHPRSWCLDCHRSRGAP